MKPAVILVLIFFTTLISLAQVPPAVSTCVGCHGPKGVSSSPLWPNLAGQKEEYLAKQLRAFKNGERKDPFMNPLVQNLSETEIEEISKYFSSLVKD